MTFTVVTLNTDESPALDNWKLSLRHNGYTDVKILGLGKKWQGFRWKTRMYIRCLRRLLAQHGDRHIVLTCDSTDVLFLESSDKMQRKFEQLQQTVVISADDTQLVGQFANRTTRDLAEKVIDKRQGASVRYKWINSGLCMGYVGYMIELYERIKSYDDDQEGAQLEWLADPGLCWVDYEQHLFATLSGMRHIAKVNVSPTLHDLKYDRAARAYRHQVTHTLPGVVHFPGKVVLTYNEFVSDWKVRARATEGVRDANRVDSRSKDAIEVWQDDLQMVAGRNLGGVWAWSFYTKTYTRAHKREIKVAAVLIVSILVATVLWKALRKTSVHKQSERLALACMPDANMFQRP